jgi:hypothetical protein
LSRSGSSPIQCPWSTTRAAATTAIRAAITNNRTTGHDFEVLVAESLRLVKVTARKIRLSARRNVLPDTVFFTRPHDTQWAFDEHLGRFAEGDEEARLQLTADASRYSRILSALEWQESGLSHHRTILQDHHSFRPGGDERFRRQIWRSLALVLDFTCCARACAPEVSAEKTL